MVLTIEDILSTDAHRIAAAPIKCRGEPVFNVKNGYIRRFTAIEEVWRPLLDQLSAEATEQAKERAQSNAELLAKAEAGDKDAQGWVKMIRVIGRNPLNTDWKPVVLRLPEFLDDSATLDRCAHCNAQFVSEVGQVVYCSNRCKAEEHRERMRTYMKKNRPSRAKTHDPIACAECGKEFVPKRKDARFCGTSCRVRHHRAQS